MQAVARIFFQTTAAIVILGAELNRGIYEFKRLGAMGLDNHASLAAAPTR